MSVVPAQRAPANPRRVLIVWGKILLLLIAVDCSIVYGEWLWQVPGEFYASVDPRWAQTHQICRWLQRPRASARPLAVIVGSSIVNFGVDEALMNQQLADLDGRGVEVVRLTMDGAPATDIERITRYVVQAKPALLVYVTAARDYPRKSQFDPTTTPLARVLYPPDSWLPTGRGKDGETFLTDLLRSYWHLYRYRGFVRLRLAWTARCLARDVGLRRLGPRPLSRQGQTPEDADRQVPFDQFRADTPVGLELYLRWLEAVKGANAGRYLTSQEAINEANYGQADNVQVAALQNLAHVCAQHGVPLVLIYPPVNPIVTRAETPYYQRALADGYVALFQRLASETGGSALDWRTVREVDDFVDFNHLNGRGRHEFSLLLAKYVRSVLGRGLPNHLANLP